MEEKGREILFRGQELRTKEWKHGHYTANKGDHVIMVGVNDCYFDKHFFVDPETVTQYINLNDSTPWEKLSKAGRTRWLKRDKMPSDWKGKKIFQKDIVEITSPRGKFIHCVSRRPEKNYILYGWIPTLRQKDSKSTLLINKEDITIKLLGNEFDNPNLLGIDNGK